MAKLIQVIETDVLRGAGVESNPMRRVKQYFSVEGELLAENDPLGFLLQKIGSETVVGSEASGSTGRSEAQK